PAVRRVLAGADEHADPSTLPGEQTAGNGAALHHPAEDDEPLAVQRGRAEAGERTARGRRITLSDDLAALPTGMQIDRLEALSPATDRCEECDVAPVIDRGRIDARQRPGRNIGRRAAGERDGPRTARGGDEDALDRPGAGDRRGECELCTVVERRHGMATEAREHAAAGPG